MTVEVRFFNPEGWKVPSEKGRPAKEIELIETAVSQTRSARSFEMGKKIFWVGDKIIVDNPVGPGMIFVEGAEIEFEDSRSSLGNRPLGAHIELLSGRSTFLILDDVLVAEIKHI